MHFLFFRSQSWMGFIICQYKKYLNLVGNQYSMERIVKVKALCDSSNLRYVAAKKFIVINPDRSNVENLRQWMEADKNN